MCGFNYKEALQRGDHLTERSHQCSTQLWLSHPQNWISWRALSAVYECFGAFMTWSFYPCGSCWCCCSVWPNWLFPDSVTVDSHDSVWKHCTFAADMLICMLSVAMYSMWNGLSCTRALQYIHSLSSLMWQRQAVTDRDTRLVIWQHCSIGDESRSITAPDDFNAAANKVVL